MGKRLDETFLGPKWLMQTVQEVSHSKIKSTFFEKKCIKFQFLGHTMPFRSFKCVGGGCTPPHTFMGMASLKDTSADFPSPKGLKVDTLFHQLAVSDEGLKGHILFRVFNVISQWLPSMKLTWPWKIHHFDGIYQDFDEIFMGELLVSGRVIVGLAPGSLGF